MADEVKGTWPLDRGGCLALNAAWPTGGRCRLSEGHVGPHRGSVTWTGQGEVTWPNEREAE